LILSQLLHAGLVRLGQEMICDKSVLLFCSVHMTLSANESLRLIRHCQFMPLSQQRHMLKACAGIDCLEHTIMHEDELH